jgi:hypothetical protein
MSDDDDKWHYQSHLDDRQADAWMEFVVSGTPSALAAYLGAGGEVTDTVRRVLIDILRNDHRENNVGGKNRWRDGVTHDEVNSIMLSGGVSKTEACRRYAKRTNQEQRTVELQFDRGSKVFSSQSDVFNSGGTPTET